MHSVNIQRHSIGFAELDATTTLADAAGGKHYFYLEIAESAATPPLRLLHIVRGPFRAQYGREVLARMLDTPEKANWKACVVPQADELRMTEQFKAAFKAYDFALEDGGSDATCRTCD